MITNFQDQEFVCLLVLFRKVAILSRQLFKELSFPKDSPITQINAVHFL